MILRSIQVSHWPKLTWFARWSRTSETVTVYHGSHVEVGSDRVFEGVWDGAFEDRRFDDSPAFCGTGLVVHSDRVVLHPPMNFNLGFIYATADSSSDEQCASNSLLCWLQCTDQTIHPDYADYFDDFLRILERGCTDDLPTMPLDQEHAVGIVYMVPWAIQTDKSWRMPPNKGAGFEPTYGAYRSFLKSTLKRLIENGTDPQRIAPMRPIAPVSEGFDSPAVAAIAKELGVTESLTILGREDARKVARALGLQLTFKHRARLLLAGKRSVLEFFAMPGGLNRTHVLFERKYVNALSITGHGGDAIWNLTSAYNDRMEIASPRSVGGLSLLEFRLRVGFHTIALPNLGMWHWSTVAQISNSPEMQAWLEPGERACESRPIPRRMGMEAGVPAELFGQKKVAGSIVFPNTFWGPWRLSLARFIRRKMRGKTASTPSSGGTLFSGSPYRWAMHWAHEEMRGHYALPDENAPGP